MLLRNRSRNLLARIRPSGWIGPLGRYPARTVLRPLTAQSTPPVSAAASSISPQQSTRVEIDANLWGDLDRRLIEKSDCQATAAGIRLIDTLRHIPAKAAELETHARENVDDETVQHAARAAAQEGGGLFYRQLKIEEEQVKDAALNYAETLKNIMELGKGSGLKYVQRIALKWYEPLNAAIEKEKRAVLKKTPAPDRTQYGPVLLLLSTEKLAVIALNTTLNMVLRTGNTGVALSDVAKTIGELVETEVNLTKLQVGNKKLPRWQQDMVNEAYTDTKYRRTLGRKVRDLLYDEAWSDSIKIKLGAALIKILIDCTRTEHGESVFLHTTYFYAAIQRRMGQLRLDGKVFKDITSRDLDVVLPRYLPMLVSPKEWNNKMRHGCYYRLRTSIMRTNSPSHLDALLRADMGAILDGLNYLGKVCLSNFNFSMPV